MSDNNITAGGELVDKDEYWNKFICDGRIESYLDYKEHLRTQEKLYDGTKSADGGWTGNTGTTNR